MPDGRPAYRSTSSTPSRSPASTTAPAATSSPPRRGPGSTSGCCPTPTARLSWARCARPLGRQLEVEVLLTAPEAPASPTGHRVYRALEQALEVRGPVVPTFISGVTDSRYFRQRGIPAYGFSPFTVNPEDQRGIHAVDEYLPADAFLRGIETLRRVLIACAGRTSDPPTTRRP